ncbi:putative alpha beta hydrolase fold protein [Lyophyllum shimeji]|uniref:Alpha beta hydrolase fold protein n=1 Tax=Lyophyllum shimeji TaxID=47721 RepID=A0A9P3UVT3_LYOSH|nr:putative alpha beta hydrolase fold protein [Lyophyllum shimeji]
MLSVHSSDIFCAALKASLVESARVGLGNAVVIIGTTFPSPAAFPTYQQRHVSKCLRCITYCPCKVKGTLRSISTSFPGVLAMATTKDRSYGNPSFIEKAGIAASLVFHLPLVLGWTLLTKPFHRNNKYKGSKRVLGDKTFYHLTRRLNVRQLQWALGDTRDVYEAWTKKQGLPLVIDELGENSRLLWIGEKRTDRVILYLHGGAYLLPPAFFVPDFWKYIQDELKSKNKGAGIAMLQYSLVPTAPFPTQLKQVVLAVQHLISAGAKPENIQITGDSAGAGLTLQLLSHLLHPAPDVPRLALSAPLRSAYLMSPWVSLTGQTGSMLSNDSSDIIGIKCLTYWGREVLDGVSEDQRPYLEASRAPEAWFENLSTVVDRVLITAGDAEALRDTIVVFAERICKQHPRAEFILQKYGVHNDPYFDFFTKEKKLGELTPRIFEWFETAFA